MYISTSKTKGNARPLITDKYLDKHFGHLEDHQYRHYNRALGCQVQSKEHYKELLEKGGYIAFEEAEHMAESNRKEGKKYDGLSDEASQLIADVKATAGKDGKITPTDKLVDGMKKVGVKFDYYNTLPECYQTGGLSNG